MAKQRLLFVAGAKKTNDIDEKLANKIFDKIASFAGYGFNKSHSACYGHISYWTGYLKANFPVEFMAALLSNEINNTDKIGVFVSECHRMGIEILPPDLNKSQLRFAPEMTATGKPAIRYGLAAIKNVGGAAMAQAIAERLENGEFETLDNFALRLDTKVVNKKILENLAKAGALDWTGETRAGMFARVEQVTAAANSAQRDRKSGQGGLFGEEEFVAEPATARGVALEEWPKDERLEQEKELLGFYVTGHPLDKFRGVVDSDRFESIGLIDELDLSDKRARFAFAGMIKSVESRTTKTGKPFGILRLEDFTGSVELMCWAESFVPARDAGLLVEGKVIQLKGQVQVDDRTDSRRITGSGLKELKVKAQQNGSGPVEISLWMARHGVETLQEIHTVLTAHPGPTPVLLHVQSGNGRRATIECGDHFHVRRSEELAKALAKYQG